MSAVNNLLKARYYQPGESTWEDLTTRVIRSLWGNRWQYEVMDAYEALLHKAFIPSSPILMNAGSKVPMMCSCYVLPMADDLDFIMNVLHQTAIIQKFGGGVGINFSSIRPQGSLISSTGGKASGPVSFMKLWNSCMDVVKQAGKRQGALIGVLNADHPDIHKFIDCKKVEGDLRNFNISVAFNSKPEGDILTHVAANIWNNGEPGVLFLDNINRNNPYPMPIEATNPCGEVPLPEFGACCLGSINLNACIDYPTNSFNYGTLERLVRIGIRFLYRVVEKSDFILPEIEEFEKEYHPLGLGVMGLADCLAKQGYVYGSGGSINFVNTLFRAIREYAEDEARYLYKKPAVLLSIAPTGTISMIAGCSYAIEPFFKLAYTKNIESGPVTVLEPALAYVLESWGEKMDKDDMAILLETGSIRDTNLPHDVKMLFRTATEIPWQQHLQMQATVQHYVDNGVSKTINIPHDSTVENIEAAITLAHAVGIKGLTMYREHSRMNEVITTGSCPSGACAL